jgi:hypothetical protein
MRLQLPTLSLSRGSRWKGLACEMDFTASARETDPLAVTAGTIKHCSATNVYLGQDSLTEAADRSGYEVRFSGCLMSLPSISPSRPLDNHSYR